MTATTGVIPAGTLIVATTTRLWLTLNSKRLTVDLPFAVDPDWLVATLTESPTSLGQVFEQDDERALLESIRSEFGPPEIPKQPSIVPDGRYRELTRVLSDLATGSRSSQELLGLLVVAGGQALWTGFDADEALRSVRFLVSMMPDPHRRGAYAAVATGRSGIAVLESALGLGQLGSVPDSLFREARPTELAFVDGRWKVVSVAEPTFSPSAGGRLGPAVVESVTSWPHDHHPLLRLAFGRTAVPNLAVLGPTDTDGAFVDGIKGVDQDEGLARLKCVAEGIERFVAGDLDQGRLRYATAEDLDSSWLHPAAIVQYNERQIAHHSVRAFDESVAEWWVECESARGPQWVPAALVYAPFPQTPPWLRFGVVTSNGVAAHRSVREAVEHGWLELVERDSFMRMWFLLETHSPVRVDLESLPAALRAVAMALASHGVLTILLLQSQDDVPVFLARLDTESGLALGAGANWEPSVALTSALSEVCSQVLAPIRSDVNEEASVRTPMDHGAFYAASGRRSLLDPMLKGPVIGFSTIGSLRARIPDRALWFHFGGQPEWPVEVVRVLDPGMIPITFGFDSEPLGRPDVERLAARGGRRPVGPMPVHPFA